MTFNENNQKSYGESYTNIYNQNWSTIKQANSKKKNGLNALMQKV